MEQHDIFMKGMSQKLKDIIILTPFSLKIWEKDSRTRQNGCISLLQKKKEVKDIRIEMNGNKTVNISRWHDSLPRKPKRFNQQTIKTKKIV